MCAVDLLKTRVQQGDGSLSPEYVTPATTKYSTASEKSDIAFQCQKASQNRCKYCSYKRSSRSLARDDCHCFTVRVSLSVPPTSSTDDSPETRNVPGVAVYFTGLNYVRTVMATSQYFSSAFVQDRAPSKHGSTLPKLSPQGNLLAGATTRVTVGVLLNPFTILKARYEVKRHRSCAQLDTDSYSE